ncbi:hypothetical protein [Paenochrobactrum pullorum]|uniref:hypothetical protein n=1 Tax=Paenochrobactrum pullorum TaxID=1324351 RepID=UPI0035BC5A0E
MYSHHLPAQQNQKNDALYNYPIALREQVVSSPKAPGVYTFHSEDYNYPLYIGKSINIRARLLSHLRCTKEARLLKQTSRISYISTAGEISALLLEAQMIKEQKPLFNRKLRKTRDTCSIIFDESGFNIIYTNDLNYIPSIDHFGLFKNKNAAKQRLRDIADQHGLCLSILGIEPHVKNRPCFRAMIHKCHGACCGKEDIENHNARARMALDAYRIAAWPYKGAIALKENFGRLKQYHILHNWRYFGSYRSRISLKNYSLPQNTLFDADMYKILVRPIIYEKAKIIELE